jgi:hypothetical protein
VEKVQALSAVDSSATPPLYQLLYDSAFEPGAQSIEQRTRILIWLRYMGFERYQLLSLQSLHRRALEVASQVESQQKSIYSRYDSEVSSSYRRVHALLVAGTALDDPQFKEEAATLLTNADHIARDREAFSARTQSISSLLDEEQPFLQGLTPRQELLFPDVLFVLRATLEPISQPGAFRGLVGSTFTPGDPNLLLTGDYETSRKPMDLAGLWSDQASDTIAAPVLHEARLEMLLFLLLQEAALMPSIDDALLALSANEPVDEPE